MKGERAHQIERENEKRMREERGREREGGRAERQLIE